ncbi:hypothetical protein [Rubinisphaera italica]|uniref:Uncharacterized protein n=1 Tax=Rubinisphaera italica TaxID=2527969 RepID=A0A5C5XJ61_9PLAN|nr:hypothetical protein [Rubinisphaera italica]TWT62844.1 hypothetical protein Pan54_35900 [Rubinisphaera italica]
MMSLETIIALNNEVAHRASSKRKLPYIPFSPNEAEHIITFPLPNLGGYVPVGWEKVEDWFVDRTGQGYESEPAITHRSFTQLLTEYISMNPDHGYGISEEGPFQVVISAYRYVGISELHTRSALAGE